MEFDRDVRTLIIECDRILGVMGPVRLDVNEFPITMQVHLPEVVGTMNSRQSRCFLRECRIEKIRSGSVSSP